MEIMRYISPPNIPTNCTFYGVSKLEFPPTLKLADITPAHKKGDRTIYDNSRHASILPPISKSFERNMYDPIYSYIDKYLSPFLFGFCKGFSTEYYLIVMLANYADDTTPHTVEITIDSLLQCLHKDTSVLIKLIISNRDKDLSLIIGNDVIECSKSVKLLGVTIDNKLDFNEHISKLYKKVSTKLHVLARVSNFMSQQKF